MRYSLMNKDDIIAEFDAAGSGLGSSMYFFNRDEVFKPWRVEKLEQIVREQAKALLSKICDTFERYR